MILDTLAASTRKRVEAAKEKIPMGTMMNLDSQASEARQNGAKESVFSFEKALKEPGMSFICEVKKASPSKGLIAPDFPMKDNWRSCRNIVEFNNALFTTLPGVLQTVYNLSLIHICVGCFRAVGN